MSRPATRCALLLGLLLGHAPLRADRVHLESGGILEVDAWRFEGEWFVYEVPGGTVALPRSAVVSLEPSATLQDGPRAARAKSPTRVHEAGDPMRAQRRLREAAAALERRDFEAASRAFQDALLLDPELVAARLGFAVTELRLGRDASALQAVLEGLARHPERPEFHELLGDVRDREDRLEDALEAWERAFALSPHDRLREKIVRARQDLEAARRQEASASAHFWLRHDEDLPRELEAAILDHLESRYDEFVAQFRDGPALPILVVAYLGERFHHVTGSDDAVAGLFDGKIRLPLGGKRRLDPATRGVLDHELAHAFIHAKSNGHAPRWLHEGLAQRMEGRTLDPAARAQVRQLLARRGPEAWAEAPFSYPAALAFVTHLEQRRGLEALVWLLARLGDGLDLDAALTEIYGEDFRGLSQRWARGLVEDEP